MCHIYLSVTETCNQNLLHYLFYLYVIFINTVVSGNANNNYVENENTIYFHHLLCTCIYCWLVNYFDGAELMTLTDIANELLL